ILWKITPASKGEPTIAKELIKNFSETTSQRAQYLTADRGYSGLPLQNLLEDAEIIPIIENPHKWKEDE
ncbi:DDE transposase, partial [Streptococcus danieliae]|nr:DDE transposase [Streptococcus danieliae]NYS50039.1 DDE transposase [Streptococcus danieliae]